MSRLKPFLLWQKKTQMLSIVLLLCLAVLGIFLISLESPNWNPGSLIVRDVIDLSVLTAIVFAFTRVMRRKRCTTCGAPFMKDAKFCTGCGAQR